MSAFAGPANWWIKRGFNLGSVLNLDAGDTRSYPGSGTTWTDLSGRNNNGTLTNGPTFNSSNGGSIVFDGTNDYVDCGNATTLQSISTLTVESWIYPSASGPGNIVSKYGNGGFRYRFETGRTILFLDRGATNGIVTTATLSLSTWNQVVITGGPSGLAIYINGSLSTSGGSAYGGGGTLGNLQIGGATDFNEYFNGRIAVVRVFNRVLSATEINQSFNAYRGRFGI